MRPAVKKSISVLAAFFAVWLAARFLLPLCFPFLLGALLLLLADTLGRSAFQPREIPVGIVISVLSAPYFLFLLRRYF